jgi:hypothetical protein
MPQALFCFMMAAIIAALAWLGNRLYARDSMRSGESFGAKTLNSAFWHAGIRPIAEGWLLGSLCRCHN